MYRERQRIEHPLTLWNRIVTLASFWLVSASLFAAQIGGTVTNGTTNKPATVEVVLLSLDGGMNEVSRTTSDSQGRFTIDVPDASASHLLRVNYQGVTYFSNAPPGASAADITIYNAAKQVEGIFEDARVYRMQTEQGQLEVSVSYTLRNESRPPRTKMDNETFEVELPQGAQLLDANATGPGGMPLATSPVPTGKKNGYALVFPIRPGETRFQVLYKVAYSGTYEFNITPDSQLSELGVLLPKSMQFTGVSQNFSQDADEAGLAVYFIKSVAAHRPVTFSVSGQGVVPREAQSGAVVPSAPESTQPPASSNEHSNSFWYALAGMILAVIAGMLWLWRRSAEPSEEQESPSARKKNQTESQCRAAAPSQDGMLDALKDELFQLEQDRLDGKVSPEEYEKSKAGLDALIRRQLRKSAE